MHSNQNTCWEAAAGAFSGSPEDQAEERSRFPGNVQLTRWLDCRYFSLG